MNDLLFQFQMSKKEKKNKQLICELIMGLKNIYFLPSNLRNDKTH